jgi:hypothetical protein
MMAFMYELLHVVAAAVLAVVGLGYDRAETVEDKPLPRAIEVAFSVTGDTHETAHGPLAYGASMIVNAGGAQVCVDIPEPPAPPALRAI